MVFGQLLLCPPKPSGAENEVENTTHVLMCPDGRALEQRTGSRTVEQTPGEASHLDGANESTGKRT